MVAFGLVIPEKLSGEVAPGTTDHTPVPELGILPVSV